VIPAEDKVSAQNRLEIMNGKRKIRHREDHTQMTFTIAVIIGITAVAVAEDFRYFAEGSPESFLRTWHIQPISMFIGSLVYVASLYMLQLLNDRDRALKYLYPYLPLVVFCGANLAVKLNPLWVGVVALASVGCSILQVRFLRNGRSWSARL
jgi:hypothetical protein